MEENDKMLSVTLNGRTFEVNKSFYHFIELLKTREEDISDVTGLINNFSEFLHYWDDFKKSKED